MFLKPQDVPRGSSPGEAWEVEGEGSLWLVRVGDECQAATGREEKSHVMGIWEHGDSAHLTPTLC